MSTWSLLCSSSCPWPHLVNGQHWKELSSVLFAPSLQAFIHIDKIILSLLFPSPSSLGLPSQESCFHHLIGPVLDFFQYVHKSLVVGGADLETELYERPQQCWVEGKDHLSLQDGRRAAAPGTCSGGSPRGRQQVALQAAFAATSARRGRGDRNDGDTNNGDPNNGKHRPTWGLGRYTPPYREGDPRVVSPGPCSTCLRLGVRGRAGRRGAVRWGAEVAAPQEGGWDGSWPWGEGVVFPDGKPTWRKALPHTERHGSIRKMRGSGRRQGRAEVFSQRWNRLCYLQRVSYLRQLPAQRDPLAERFVEAVGFQAERALPRRGPVAVPQRQGQELGLGVPLLRLRPPALLLHHSIAFPGLAVVPSTRGGHDGRDQLILPQGDERRQPVQGVVLLALLLGLQHLLGLRKVHLVPFPGVELHRLESPVLAPVAGWRIQRCNHQQQKAPHQQQREKLQLTWSISAFLPQEHAVGDKMIQTVMLNITRISLRFQCSGCSNAPVFAICQEDFLFPSHFTDAVSCFPLYLQTK